MEKIRRMEEADKTMKRLKQESNFQNFKNELGIKSEPKEKKIKLEPLEDSRWIYKNVVVKIKNKKLGENFHKQKAFIESTDGFLAVVQVRDHTLDILGKF